VLYNAVVITDTSGVTDTSVVTTPVESWHDLVVTKTAELSSVEPGGWLTYTIAWQVSGNEPAPDVTISDTTPVSTTFWDAIPSAASAPVVGDTGPVIWSLGDQYPPASGVVTMVVLVDSALVSGTVLYNAVVITDTSGVTDTGEVTTPVTSLVPGLQLVKTVAPGVVVYGMPCTYTIRITNTGDVTFDPLVLTDTLPPDFHYVRGSGVPMDANVIAEPLLVWFDLGPLAPGENLAVTFAVTATPDITGTYVNVATAAGTIPGGVITGTDNTPVFVEDPVVVVDKRAAAVDLDNVQPNYVTFTIAITNVGSSVIDVLPLLDVYDTYYLSFANATPYPEEDADDGNLTWYDLTGPAPHGFDRNLLPREAFVITTVFRVVHDITTTINTAVVSGAIDIYGNPAGDDDDDAQIDNVPTAVELLYFQVGEVNGHEVRLEWATAVEVDNFGFNLYRAPLPDRDRANHVAFVPSQSHGGGAAYTYTDTVPAGGGWWYWLADVDTSGQETFHGPVSAGVGAAAWPHRLYLPIVTKR